MQKIAATRIRENAANFTKKKVQGHWKFVYRSTKIALLKNVSQAHVLKFVAHSY